MKVPWMTSPAISLILVASAIGCGDARPEPTKVPLGPDTIAFTSNRDGNNEVYIMDADGSNQTRLTDDLAYDGGPSWSPSR